MCLLDYEWCTGDMNLSLRCVRWYYALNKPCDVFVGLWMMYGRDKSAPTVCSLYTFMQWINLVVCLLDYEWCTGEMNLPLRLRCVRFYTFTQWMNLVVCLLDYEWLSGEINQPLRLRCVRCYTFTHWINLLVCLLDYEWCTGEINLPLRLRCVRWYYAMNIPCGMSVDIHFK